MDPTGSPKEHELSLKSSTPMAEINVLRLSFVYVETLLGLVTGELAQAPYDFLVHRFSYVDRFDRAAGDDEHGDLQRPWPHTRGKSFWTFYFEGNTPHGSIKGEQAWRGITPFRQRLPWSAESTAGSDCQISIDAFVYPHGVATVLYLSLAGKFTPELIARRALEIRRRPIFSTSTRDRDLTLDRLAGRILDATRTIAFGTVPAGTRPPYPFSVATVIRGSGVDSEKPLPEKSPEHRLLEVLTAWPPAWEGAGTPPLSKATVPISKGSPSGHLLYARNRGRAPWMPGYFCLDPGVVRSLGCLHRNLVFASMQVDSLAYFMAATSRLLDEGHELGEEHRDLARRAASVLGRLYGGASSIYRSRSPRAQIDEAGLQPGINTIRAWLGQEPLHASPS
jgi:hypothetical protein